MESESSAAAGRPDDSRRGWRSQFPPSILRAWSVSSRPADFLPGGGRVKGWRWGLPSLASWPAPGFQAAARARRAGSLRGFVGRRLARGPRSAIRGDRRHEGPVACSRSARTGPRRDAGRGRRLRRVRTGLRDRRGGSRGALAGLGTTAGVLGGGHRRFFPRRNRALAESMLAAGGCVDFALRPRRAGAALAVLAAQRRGRRFGRRGRHRRGGGAERRAQHGRVGRQFGHRRLGLPGRRRAPEGRRLQRADPRRRHARSRRRGRPRSSRHQAPLRIGGRGRKRPGARPSRPSSSRRSPPVRASSTNSSRAARRSRARSSRR